MLYREAGDFKTSYVDDSQTFPIRFDRIGFWIAMAVAWLVVPFVINDYWASSLLVPFLIYAIAAIGLNILTGYCGQVSLGTGGFMAVGAYACYKLMTSFPDVSILIHIVLAGGITAVVGAAFGLPSLRIKGFYLAVATLKAKLTAFAVSSFFVGLAGALFFAVYLGAVEVGEAFGIQKSFLVLFMIIIGGLGSIFGSFAGAAFLVVLPVALKWVGVDIMGWPTDLVAHFQLVIVGALIMFFLIKEPHGLAQLWRLAKEKLRLWPFPY